MEFKSYKVGPYLEKTSGEMKEHYSVEVHVHYANELRWIKVFKRTDTELIPVYSDAPKVFIEKMINEFWTMAELGTLKQGMLEFITKNNLKRPH